MSKLCYSLYQITACNWVMLSFWYFYSWSLRPKGSRQHLSQQVMANIVFNHMKIEVVRKHFFFSPSAVLLQILHRLLHTHIRILCYHSTQRFLYKDKWFLGCINQLSISFMLSLKIMEVEKGWLKTFHCKWSLISTREFQVWTVQSSTENADKITKFR